MDSTFIFVIILVLLIYTFYWTYFNDYGLFLFIIILLLSGLFIYKFIDEKILYYEHKLINRENKIINIISEQMPNFKNLKSSIFGLNL